MAKVYLDPGHGGNDPGAVKYLVERDINLVEALACKEYLESNGVNTKISRTNNTTNTSINTMAREANNWGADLVVSIHNNAGGGDGFEVYHSIVGGTGKTLAKNIESEIIKIGQNSRGLKTKKNSSGSDYYGMIRLTDAPAVIVEGAFVDNKADASQADTLAEQKAFGVAYAKGILKTLGIADKGGASGSSASGYKVKVKVAALNIRAGAGTNYNITGVIRDKGVYTIVATSGRWGKLKSGAGWICLDYVEKL